MFLTGGFEPSASLMYLVLYELSKKPEIQNRLRQEIMDALAQTDGKVTYDMVTFKFTIVSLFKLLKF